MEPFLNSGGAFRPHIVKVGALSAPTQEILLKYSSYYIRVEINTSILIFFVMMSLIG